MLSQTVVFPEAVPPGEQCPASGCTSYGLAIEFEHCCRALHQKIYTRWLLAPEMQGQPPATPMKKGCDLGRALCRLLLEPLLSSVCASTTGPFGHLICSPFMALIAACSAEDMLMERLSHQHVNYCAPPSPLSTFARVRKDVLRAGCIWMWAGSSSAHERAMEIACLRGVPAALTSPALTSGPFIRKALQRDCTSIPILIRCLCCL